MPPRAQTGRPASLSTPELHAISRALCDPRRFQILKQIAAHASTACTELRAEFPIAAATLSHHLKELESSGLIEITRRGKFVDAAFRRTTWDSYLAELQNI